MTQSPCTSCGKDVIDSSRALQCQICDFWTHIECCGVCDDLYDMLMHYHGANLEFTCDTCRPKVEHLRLTQDGPSDDTADEFHEVDNPDVTCVPSCKCSSLLQSTTTGPGSSFTSSTPTKRKPTGKKTFASVATTAIPKPSTPIVDLNTPDAKPGVATKYVPLGPTTAAAPNPQQSANRRSPPPREQCLIVVNIPESNSVKPQERLDDDLRELRSCLNGLFVAGEEQQASTLRVRAAYRLGRQHEEVSRPRPLKVVLSTAEEAQLVFKRTYRLKGQSVRFLRDLSPEDRGKLREALTSLRERRANGETDLFIRDFQVMRRRPRVHWVPLSLAQTTVSQEAPVEPQSAKKPEGNRAMEA